MLTPEQRAGVWAALSEVKRDPCPKCRWAEAFGLVVPLLLNSLDEQDAELARLRRIVAATPRPSELRDLASSFDGYHAGKVRHLMRMADALEAAQKEPPK